MSQVNAEYTPFWNYLCLVGEFVEEATVGPEVKRRGQEFARNLSDLFLALRPVPKYGAPYVTEVCKGLNNLTPEDLPKFAVEMINLGEDVETLKSWFSVFACIQ